MYRWAVAPTWTALLEGSQPLSAQPAAKKIRTSQSPHVHRQYHMLNQHEINIPILPENKFLHLFLTCISSSWTSWFFNSLRQNCTAFRSLASTKTWRRSTDVETAPSSSASKWGLYHIINLSPILATILVTSFQSISYNMNPSLHLKQSFGKAFYMMG